MIKIKVSRNVDRRRSKQCLTMELFSEDVEDWTDLSDIISFSVSNF